MTTTEWVERYNRAFEEAMDAASFQERNYPISFKLYPATFKRLPPERWIPDWSFEATD